MMKSIKIHLLVTYFNTLTYSKKNTVLLISNDL